MIKYALRRHSNGMFIDRGNSPGGRDDAREVNEKHLFSSETEARRHVSWMRHFAQWPDKAPKVILADGETFDLVTISVTHCAMTSVEV